MTGYSNTEEELVNAMNKIPFQLEKELKKSEAKYTKALQPFVSYTRVDGTVITGQNPQSTAEVAETVLAVLKMIEK